MFITAYGLRNYDKLVLTRHRFSVCKATRMHNPKEKSMTYSFIRDGNAFLEYEFIGRASSET